MRLVGVDPYLEEQADMILAEDRKAQVAREKTEVDYLTEGQMESRRRREVYNKNGFPEGQLYNGLFRRAYNPMMGKRGGKPSSDD